jgi:hypothetical protein
VSLPLGTALVATWTFTASGVLHDPSPAPTVIEAAYPDGTVLAGLPLALTKVRTGVYQAQIFSAGQVTQVGTYSALAYSSDTALDSPYGDGQAVWENVGINSVSAFARPLPWRSSSPTPPAPSSRRGAGPSTSLIRWRASSLRPTSSARLKLRWLRPWSASRLCRSSRTAVIRTAWGILSPSP